MKEIPMETNTAIDRISNSDKIIYSTVLSAIQDMNDGTSMPIDDLTEQVNETLEMPFNELRPFVAHFARSIETDKIAYVSTGKFGGVVKGVRPDKTAKTKKTTKTPKIEETN
jgi:hypothetical protein